LIPQQWKVFENTTKILTVGLLSNEKFNGNSVLMELKVDSNGLLEYHVAGRAIDLSQYLITRKIEFTSKTFNGLFSCLKTVSLCHGVYLDVNETDIFSSSKVCVKETAQ
jgi:hypothetical protein